MAERPLCRGDLVEVKSAKDILDTLDSQATLDALPFMPEMIPLVGRRFTVDKRAEKICDTIYSGGSRRLRDTVLLAELRCDGAGHAGCQAECRLFWKEAWLRRVEPGTPVSGPSVANGALAALERRVGDGLRGEGGRWRCQATELGRASKPIRTFDPVPYVREVACGNVSLGRFLVVTARAAVEEPARRLGLFPNPFLRGEGNSSPAEPPLNLQPGEWVQIRSSEEIARTLTAQGKNRGLWFDREMAALCGRTFRVRRRITHFIEDRTGDMVALKSDCVTLEGAVCSGELSLQRWFCPRAIYPYWRECWLRRVPPPARG